MEISALGLQKTLTKSNIVSGNYGYFQQLYRSVLEECPYVHQSASKTNEYEQVSKLIVY